MFSSSVSVPTVPRLRLLLAVLGWCLAGWVAPGRAQFVERAQVAGVDLNYPTQPGGHAIVSVDAYSVGNPSCACDLNGDGWTDLIVGQAGAPCLVFINQRDGTFRDEAQARGLDTAVDIGGIAAGDLQNRGVPDIVMVPVVGSRQYLFVNDGTGHFTERAVERGADAPVTEEAHRGQSVSLVDYDRDGYLDIQVAEWSVFKNGENQWHSVLLHNQGRVKPGYFENRTTQSGLNQPSSGNVTSNYAMGWADFDGDGYPDVFIAGDFGTSQLWWNNGDGTFTNGTAASGITNGADGMGLTLLDYDGDGRIDLFMSAISLINDTSDKGFVSDNKLFRNLGNRRFAETATTAGVKLSGWGWGAQTLDANNDGWPDLAVTNGYVGPGSGLASAQTDPTKLFINQNGTFGDKTDAYAIKDTGLGRSLVVFDYDNDGREDLFITQTAGHRVLYHNETPTTNAHWLALRFVGSVSNRDGYGAEVTITAGGRSQTAVYNPTNAYIGQREPRLHFGLGSATVATSIKVKWPSGTEQELTAVTADQLITVTEGLTPTAAPAIVSQPGAVSAAKDSRVVLSVTGQGFPTPVYNWYRNDVRIEGQNNATLVLDRVQPADEGSYTVELVNPYGKVTSQTATITVTANLAAKSVARWWNEALLDGIRKDTPNPPVHARNLFHVSAALWDAFWAYERNGWTGHREAFVKEAPVVPADENLRSSLQTEAMSYAAFTVIQARFARSPGAAATTSGIRWLMRQYGFNPDVTETTASGAAATGIRIGRGILSQNLADGANEANDYADATGFTAANPPLRVVEAGVGPSVDPDRWQPLDLVNTVTQNGIVLGPSVQTFVGSNARLTRTFALQRDGNGFILDDPGAPPRFNASTKDQYLAQAREVLTFSAQLDATDGVTLDISPGKILNNTVGKNDGVGHATNPYTGLPYPNNVVLLADYGRVLAEYWADGPHSETPPGHWNVIFNEVSDNPGSSHKFQGQGSPLRRLEWDVCGYLALNTAVHDAACAAWGLKWKYNSARPITMIRYLASLGQSSDPTLPGYHADGLPLVPGKIEIITAESSAVGQRHAHLAASVGKIAVKAWKGPPASATQTSGVGWILGSKWVPYQRDTFVTPAFPGYTSGHSTFSQAGAVVMTLLTGNPFFPGGMATYDFPAGTALGFEAGPARSIQLQWATYYDAADQAGLSRLYGGIHISADDLTGRLVGAKIGQDDFTLFLQYYGATAVAPQAPTAPTPSTTTTPTTVPTTSPSTQTAAGSGGGGGAPSGYFLEGLALLCLARRLNRYQPKARRP